MIMGKIGWIPLVAAIVVATPSVDAHVVTSGAAFHNYNAAEGADIDYVSQGVRNLSTSSRFVVAPVAFVRSNPGSSKFTVTGRSPTGASTSFTLWNYRFGVFQSADSFNTIGAAGFYSIDKTVVGLDQFSTVSLLAALPPNSDAVIYSIVQQQ
jgi:hypothetical protein